MARGVHKHPIKALTFALRPFSYQGGMPRRESRRRPHVALPQYPGLDGLRALAVVAVLLYHGGVSWSGGGFLGVEMFFVLSGFLITSLLVGEWGRSGAIALRAFWARRAR